MVTEVNKYGLSRYIEEPIKRAIRQACNHGCAICGDAIYTYEHIDPEFHEEREHDPEKMTLLCLGCHGKVTSSFWSKQKVIEARQNPICKKKGFSHFNLDIGLGDDFIVKIGNTRFKNLQSIIEIDGEDILSVYPPEELNAPPRISARFFDRNNVNIACIVQNQWRGSSDAFDIEAKGGTFKIRSAVNKIDLFLRVQPTNLFVIEKIELAYKNTRISGSTSKGLKVQLQNASVKIPTKPDQIQEAPFWLSIKEGKIYLGNDFVESLNRKEYAGYYEIENADVELIDSADVNSPVNPRPGRKVLKITGGEGGGRVLFNPTSLRKEMPKQRENGIKLTKKIRPNDPCHCGSGQKYKRCHGNQKGKRQKK